MAYRLSYLDAINRIAHSLPGQQRFSALDSDSAAAWPTIAYGPSMAATIEFELEQASRAIQGRGNNALVCKCQLLPGTAGNVITFPTTVLRAVPAGKDEGRRWIMRNGAAFDQDTGSASTFTSGSLFQWDLYHYIKFSELANDIQELIIKEASVIVQARFGRDDNMHQKLVVERDIAEVAAQKQAPRPQVATDGRPIPMGGGQSAVGGG